MSLNLLLFCGCTRFLDGIETGALGISVLTESSLNFESAFPTSFIFQELVLSTEVLVVLTKLLVAFDELLFELLDMQWTSLSSS